MGAPLLAGNGAGHPCRLHKCPKRQRFLARRGPSTHRDLPLCPADPAAVVAGHEPQAEGLARSSLARDPAVLGRRAGANLELEDALGGVVLDHDLLFEVAAELVFALLEAA